MPDPTPAPLMLGVSGLRGIVGQSLTPEVTARFAAAFGSWIADRRTQHDQARGAKRPDPPMVAVGTDGRAGGDALKAAAVAGLSAVGCAVVDADIVMTPTLGFLVDHFGYDAGIMVTASHNPQEWNGLKMLVRDAGMKQRMVHACAPIQAQADEILARFRTPQISYRGWAGTGFIYEADQGTFARQRQEWAHVKGVLEALAPAGRLQRIKARRYRVVLDSVGGAGQWLGDGLLESLGCTTTQDGPYRAGRFSHAPEPTRENLGGLCRRVRSKKAHIGFAQDPDADRLAIVDERGQYIGEEYTLALAAESLLSTQVGLKARPPKGKRPAEVVLVTNLSTSRMIDDIAARYGARVVRTPVGEANVVEAMKREKAQGRDVVLGGEGNGGVIWPKVTYVRDSLSAMALVLALMARTGKKVSELVAEIPAYAIEKRKVELARKEDARPTVERIAAAYRGQNIDLQDGVRVDWLDRKAWLHVRASNTEPIMRLISEARTAAESRAILDEAARVIAG